MAIEITWFGHAAFLVEGDGVRILLDPYRSPDAGTYAPIAVPADVVLVSHENPRYHSHWEAALGNPVRLNGLDFANAPGGVQAHGLTFRAVRVYESPAREVPVSMPYFTLDGLTICHSGDLGHALSNVELAPIRGCDIFLAVAGGPPTLPIPDLKAAIDAIAPRLVLPMHYQTGKVNLNLHPVDDLRALFPPNRVIDYPSSTLTVNPNTLPSETTLVILPPAR